MRIYFLSKIRHLEVLFTVRSCFETSNCDRLLARASIESYSNDKYSLFLIAGAIAPNKYIFLYELIIPNKSYLYYSRKGPINPFHNDLATLQDTDFDVPRYGENEVSVNSFNLESISCIISGFSLAIF